MSKYKINADDILQATNGGLDVIMQYYPNAKENKAFKIRDEKTASTSLKQYKNIWYITDFGDDAKGKNALDIVKDEENLDFYKALLYINDRFCNGKFNNSETSSFNKPIVEDAENKTGKTILEFNEKITDKELSFIGKDVTQKIAKRYNLRSIKYYISKGSKEKGPKKITATPDFPIFCFDQDDWQKIIQPKGSKDFRFFHVGTKEKDFIFGLQQLENDIKKLKKEAKIKIIKENEGEEKKEAELDERIQEEIKKDMPDVIIASGERDALNIASAGYTVLWQNSETADLSYGLYWKIKDLSKNIYNVPDLDATGIRQGYALALKYTDIRTIWLPNTLRMMKDWRGNPCKDATDFFEKFSHAKKVFGKMKGVAYSLKFWQKDKKKNWHINNTSFYEFLHANGYYRLVDLNNKFLYTYIKLKGNIVEKINPENKGSVKNHVKDFVISYIEKKFLPVAVRNMFFKTRQLDENSLSGLKYYHNFDFKTYSKDFQYMFFKNKSWNITKNGIEEFNLTNIKKNVWEDDIKLKCSNVKKHKKPMFEISYTETYIKHRMNSKNKESFPNIDKYDIVFNDNMDKKFIWLKYLINTSRIFWQKGDKITEAEKKEQRLHLINKIYSIGYLAHRYKNPSHNWAVFAIDGKESEAGKSYGGSGKSICYRSIEHINKQFYIGGRSPKKLESDFLYDGVDKYTYNILVDDTNQYLDFGIFFPLITGKMNVNPKNKQQYTLDSEDSPKFCFTSNFGLRNVDTSTSRRILYTVFSDYYHKMDDDGNYTEDMDPLKEFFKNLFTDFTEEEWNSFYNFIALAIQTYLKFDKIEPPMQSVTIRNLRAAIGEDILTWANDFFSKPEYLDHEFSKEEAYKDCTEKYLSKRKLGFFTIRKFKTAVKSYCKYRGWTFNPPDACNDNQGRIMKDLDGKISEYFYVQTDDKEIKVNNETTDNTVLNPLNETDDIPF